MYVTAGGQRRLDHAQHLLNGAPDLSRLAGLGQPRLATLLQERRAFGPQGVPGEKNHLPSD